MTARAEYVLKKYLSSNDCGEFMVKDVNTGSDPIFHITGLNNNGDKLEFSLTRRESEATWEIHDTIHDIVKREPFEVRYQQDGTVSVDGCLYRLIVPRLTLQQKRAKRAAYMRRHRAIRREELLRLRSQVKQS